MTKEKRNVGKLNLKWHKQRSVLKVAFIQISSFLLANYIILILGQYVASPEKSKWICSAIIANMIMAIAFAFIYVHLEDKAKNKKYFIHLIDRKCVKGDRIIKYSEIQYTQSITQRWFGLCTLYFLNSSQELKLPDVSVESLKYLE